MKKKRTTLPRVTIMAMSKRDLVAFVQAVETLRLLVDDLRIITAEAKNRKAGPRAAQAAAAAHAAAAQAAAVPKGGAS